jgi:hypothetical protein
VIRVEPGRPTLLRASDATFEGFAVKGSRLVVRDGVITGWMTEDQRANWVIDCSASGRYKVRMQLRCGTLYAGSTFALGAGERVLQGTVQGRDARGPERRNGSPPGGVLYWQDVGALDLRAGRTKLSLAATYMPYGYVFADVRALELHPTEDGTHHLSAGLE